MYIQVNGVNIYYEVIGQGKPLILVHGNGENHHIFAKISNKLKNYYTLYLIDSRGHGQSSKVSSLSYNDLSLDIIEFVKKMGLINCYYYGFSDGGIIGIMIAIKNPNLFSKIIVSGANLFPSGIKKRYLYLYKFLYLITKKESLKMMIKEPNISIDDLKNIKDKFLITCGSNDVILYKHTMLIHKNILDSDIKIYPKQSHSSYIVDNDILVEDMINFYK